MNSSCGITAIQTLSLEQAHIAVAKAIELARGKFGGRPICVSICDQYGLLLAFSRMDGAPLRTIAIAQQKAYTSVRMESSTVAFAQRLASEGVTARDFCDDALTPLAGGQPVKSAGGRIVAGIGISGLKPEEDAAIAAEIAADLQK